MSPSVAAPTFFLAVVVILLVCRLVGLVMVRLGQPPVVGEMIAGVLLGPSLLGLFLPQVQDGLFPDDIRSLLYVSGQIGLIIFMFGAGYEFRVRGARGTGRAIAAIATAGTAVPLALGVGVCLIAAGWPGIFLPEVSPVVSFAFVGVALSITAFPMLARIITERGLAGTRLGTLALACGAVDDVVAWILLAGVLALHSGSTGPVVLAVGGATAFALLLAFVARPLLKRAMTGPAGLDQRLLVTAAALFAAAYITDMIGLYAVFGAFCLGVVFPRHENADVVVATLLPIGRIVFLPLFFTYSGLNTQFALLADPVVLAFAVLCIVAAVVGKLGACAVAARLAGQPPAIALRVATLINARGLMQLIAVNIGLAAGIVSPALFSVLVLVALVTTIMTAPVLSWLDRRDARRGIPVLETVDVRTDDRPDRGEPSADKPSADKPSAGEPGVGEPGVAGAGVAGAGVDGAGVDEPSRV